MKTNFYLWNLVVLLGMAGCGEKENNGPITPPLAKEYAVTFCYETATGTHKVVQKVKAGQPATPPRDTVYKEGFYLVNWSSLPNIVVSWDFSTIVNKDLTFYAYYKYPVIFDYRGKAANDTVWMSDFIPTVQKTLAAPHSTSDLEYFTLDGWYKNESCTTAWNFSTEKISGVLTLYAKWAPLYTVNFNSTGGAAVAAVKVKENSKFLAPNEPSHASSNLIFGAWCKDVACNTPWRFDVDSVTSHVTLYAKWVPAYVVNFNTMGGTSVTPSKVKALGQLARPEKPTNSNSDLLFWGWYKESACTNLWNFYADTVTDNLMLYAKWYSITAAGGVYDITCGGTSLTVLKNDLPGKYTWTKDGARAPMVHYNPCPQGWQVPAIDELDCMVTRMDIINLSGSAVYWSRSLFYSNQAAARHPDDPIGMTGYADAKGSIRCIKVK